MHLVALTLLAAVTTILASPTPEKRQPLDPDKIMADVYSNSKGFMDFDLKISPDLYDDVLAQFQRFDRDYPDLPDNEAIEPVKIAPQTTEKPVPTRRPVPVYPKVRSRFFRLF